MNPQSNPDERFGQIDRAEKLIAQLAEQGLQTNQRLDRLAQKVEALADGQKHTDSKLDALTDIVRQWIERHGNGSATH